MARMEGQAELNRSIRYTTHASYRDERWIEHEALAVLSYERATPFTFDIQVVCNMATTQFTVNRQAAIVALRRPVTTPDVIYAYSLLGHNPAITLTTRGHTSRQMTMTTDALTIFLGRTQILVPLGLEERTLRQCQSGSAHTS